MPGQRVSTDAIETAARELADKFSADFGQTERLLRKLSRELPSLQRRAGSSNAAAIEYVTQIICTAFHELPWRDAIRAMRAMSADVLERRLWVSLYLAGKANDGGIPLYLRSELARHISDFRRFLDAERRHLLETGLPKREFRRCRWLHARIGPTYPVRQTQFELLFDTSTEGESPAHGWAKLVRTGKLERIACPHAEADLIAGLTGQNAERLVGLREQLLETKLMVLDAVQEALRQDARANLWSRCVEILGERLTREEARFCRRMDRIYEKESSQAKTTSRYLAAALGHGGPAPPPGGLTAILELVGHVEKELRIGTMHETRKALGPFVKRTELGPVLVSIGEWPYLEFLGREGQGTLDRALDFHDALSRKEPAFWRRFDRRVSDAIASDFGSEITIRVRVRRAVAAEFRLRVENYAASVKHHIDAKGFLPAPETTPADPTAGQKAIAAFPPLPGLDWGEVSIIFTSHEAVRITARGKSKKFTYSELRMNDRRKGDRPDTQWLLLWKLAINNGVLDCPSDANMDKLKSHVRNLCRCLEALLGIHDKEKPIRYRKAKEGGKTASSYFAAFNVRDESHGGVGEAGIEDKEPD